MTTPNGLPPPAPEVLDAVGRLLAVDRFPVAGEILRARPGDVGESFLAVCDTILERIAADPELRDRGPDPALVRAMRAFLVRCATASLDVVFPSDSDIVDPTAYAVVATEVNAANKADNRYAESGDPAALDVAADAWRRVLTVPELDSAYPGLRAALLNDAGGSALRRFRHGGVQLDLELAIHRFAEALTMTPPVSVRRIGRLGNLAMALREAHERYGEPQAIVDAEELLREALRLVGLGGDSVPGAAEATTNLALVLRDRYLADGELDRLREAIGLAERAMTISNAPAPRIMLGDLLSQYFPHSGELAHLERAVDLLTQALDRVSVNSPERPRVMVDAAIALTERHAVLGDLADLDHAIDLLTAARSALPSTAPDLASASVQLALALYRRFEVTGRLDELDRAVELLTATVRSAPATEVARPTWRTNLATALIQRYRRRGDVSDLDEAIATYEAVLDAPGVDRYVTRNNLGNALRDRYRRAPADADLDRSVELLRGAVALCVSGSVRHASTCANLGEALRYRYLLVGDDADLQEALDVTAQAVTAGSRDADAARRWFGRAAVLDDAARIRGDARPAEVDDAYRVGCAAGAAVDPESVLVAAQDWGRAAVADTDWTTAAEAFGIAVEAIGSLVHTQAARRHQETWLHASTSLAGRAGHAMTQAGDPAGGVVAIERCRAAMLSEALGREHADLAELTTQRPDLTERYRAAARLLAGRTARETQSTAGVLGR